MLTKKRYSVKNLVVWTRWETLVFIIYAAVITALYAVLDFTFLNLPWTPIALIGTAVAFVVGFQNNSAYGRIWEARKIWGGIVNTSKTWGMKIQDMVSDEHSKTPVDAKFIANQKRQLIYRHIAWMTSLRHAMRQPKPWEVSMKEHTNKEWENLIHIPERLTSLEDDLKPYLSPEEKAYILNKGSKATALLFLQSKHIRELKEKHLIWEFSFLELENVLQELFTLQGQSERIKNFPYPRQFATLSNLFVKIFILLLPFGIIPEFSKIGIAMLDKFPIVGNYFVWLAIPFCVIVSWVFHTMERIGRVGENPFEGTANDVPISTISRGIEIDLREMMDENNELIPKQFPSDYDVQM
jgi:putative membrane protein